MNKINSNLILAFIISLMVNNQAAFGAEVKPAEEIKKEKKAQEKGLENSLEKYKLVVLSAIIATILIGGGSAWYKFVKNKSLIKPIKRKPQSQTISPTIPTKKTKIEMEEDKIPGKGPLPAADLALIRTISAENKQEDLLENLKAIKFASRIGKIFNPALKGSGLNNLSSSELESLIGHALNLTYEEEEKMNRDADEKTKQYNIEPDKPKIYRLPSN